MAIRVSQKLKLASLEARCRGFRQYQQAAGAGLHQTVFSSLVNDIRPVRPNDPRVIAIGKVLGLEAVDCFEAGEKGR